MVTRAIELLPAFRIGCRASSSGMGGSCRAEVATGRSLSYSRNNWAPVTP